MTIGTLRLDLSIGGAMSLKDKRRAVKSVKDRIANNFNVSVAEVDALDNLRSAVLGVAMVGNDHRYIDGALCKVVDFVKTCHQVDLDDYDIEIL